MKRLLLTLLFSGLAAALQPAEAQTLDAFKRQLAAPAANARTSGEASVTATEAGSAARIIAQAAQQQRRTRVMGYRVCIYIDNEQSARAGAVEAKTRFEEAFPDTKVYMVYENPYFKVKVGNCLTTEEAIILKGQIASLFPNAFPIREELLHADLVGGN